MWDTVRRPTTSPRWSYLFLSPAPSPSPSRPILTDLTFACRRSPPVRARASDARIRRVYLFYVFLHTSFKTRLSTCRGRTVARRPPRIAVPSSLSFSLFKLLSPRNHSPRDTISNLRAIFRSLSIHLPHDTPFPLFHSPLLKPVLCTKHPRIGEKWMYTFFLSSR